MVPLRRRASRVVCARSLFFSSSSAPVAAKYDLPVIDTYTPFVGRADLNGTLQPFCLDRGEELPRPRDQDRGIPATGRVAGPARGP